MFGSQVGAAGRKCWPGHSTNLSMKETLFEFRGVFRIVGLAVLDATFVTLLLL
jgi:hypothetical protein